MNIARANPPTIDAASERRITAATASLTPDADGLRTSAGDLSLTNDAQNGLLSAIAGNSTYATFDARDRMKTQGDLDLTYNDNGEMVSRRNRTTGDELALEYTTLGDLKTAQTPDGEQIEYLLDAAGRRVGKKVDGRLTQGLIYSPEAYGPVAELDQNNDLVARFVYGRGSNVPDYMQKGSTTYRLITDQLGSVVMVVDATTGAIAQEIQYGPFGEVLADSNPGFQPFGFAGGIYDQDTGLVHFGAREYDAELGRWSASDPIGFGGGDSNLYGYVLGDPVNRVDPSGLYGLDDLGRDVIRTINEIPSTIRNGDATSFLKNEVAGGVTEVAVMVACATSQLILCPLAQQKAKELGDCMGPGFGTGRILGGIAVGGAGGAAGAGARAASSGARGLAPEVAYAAPRRAPTVFQPYGRYDIYDDAGNLKQVTTYDKYGRRHTQYDVGPGTRHGEGYHRFEYDDVHPDGVRGPHTEF